MGTEPAEVPLPQSPPIEDPQVSHLNGFAMTINAGDGSGDTELSPQDPQDTENISNSDQDSEEGEQQEDLVNTPQLEPELPIREPHVTEQSEDHPSILSPPLPAKDLVLNHNTVPDPRNSEELPASPRSNGAQSPPPKAPARPPKTLSTDSSTHKRSLTIARGNTVSVVLISSALDIIAASKEAKRSAPLRESTQRALDLVRANDVGNRREVFEPLRLACETKNEKLMIASLDCISKLISYSFFAEETPASQAFHSPPPSPNTSGHASAGPNQQGLVDLVVHTITSCHSETTPEPVSLQIVKALLSLVLSSTTLVHHSSLLKAVRTVYNVFLLSTDAVNQMVAQGGLTQMVHHVFTRCKVSASGARTPLESHPFPLSADALSSKRGSFPSSESTTSVVSGRRQSEGETLVSESSVSLPLPPASDTTDENSAHSETAGEDYLRHQL